MAKDRPTLTSLSDRLARKPAPVERDAKIEGETNEASIGDADAGTERASPSTNAKAPDGRVQIIVRMSPAERKALRQIALDQDTTVQALAEEAIRGILRQQASGRTPASKARR